MASQVVGCGDDFDDVCGGHGGHDTGTDARGVVGITHFVEGGGAQFSNARFAGRRGGGADSSTRLHHN